MIIYALSDGPLWMKIFQEYFRVHTPIGHSHQGGTFRSEGWYISYFIGSMVIFRVVLRIFLPVKNSTKWKYRQDIPSRDPPCLVSNFSPPLSLSCCFWCFFWGEAQRWEPWRDSGCHQATCLHESPPSAKPPSAWPAPCRNDTGKRVGKKNTPKRQ